MSEIKKVDSAADAKDATDAFNAVKRDKLGKGEIMDERKISIRSNKIFAGRFLKRDKHLRDNGRNFSVKAGTEWKDIPLKLQKKIAFSEADFKKIK